MNFREVQLRVFDLMTSGAASLADYLACQRDLKNLAEQPPSYFRNLRVAFLSNFTLQGLPEVFEVQAIFHNLRSQTYLSPYNQYPQDILNPNSELNRFKPDLVYFLMDMTDVDQAQFTTLLNNLLDNVRAKVIVPQSFLALEANGFSNRNLVGFDWDGFIDKIGRDEFWYTKYKELGDLRLSPAAFLSLANAIMGYAVSVAGADKKCLVTDLDNTLWRGVVGEDDLERIDPNINFQDLLLGFYSRGVVLAVNSRNNQADALAVFDDHQEMRLRKNHLAAWRINWDDKVTNMRSLAAELNLGLESFVFVDDDPFQRGLVKESLPEVAVLAPGGLEAYQGFTKLTLTEEDAMRGQMYAQERGRKELEAVFTNLGDFLSQLQMGISVEPISALTIPRVSQLTQKTNQFNLVTRRYSEAEVQELISSGWKIWTAQARDRFGDYGIIAVAVVEPRSNSVWRIDNFLLSCRVLGRGLETAFLSYILDKARNEGVLKVVGEFVPTSKNKPCEMFYQGHKFKEVARRDNSTFYEYDFSQQCPSPEFIKFLT
ncbi:MAG: HAD-IIIC family phosphatase [Parcubacteria group bacterium]|nr:HAD-IIIC family phosphatase [Parcubacteria group bacterium]